MFRYKATKGVDYYIKEIELMSPKRVALWQWELKELCYFDRSKYPGDSIESSYKCVGEVDHT